LRWLVRGVRGSFAFFRSRKKQLVVCHLVARKSA